MAENKKENANKTFPLHFVKNKLEDVPKFLEQKDKEWVFWGEKNDLPNQLIEAQNYNTIHGSMCKIKSNLVAGDEILIEEGDELYVPNEEESLMDMTIKLALDLVVIGGCIIQVTKAEKGNKKIINHLPIQFFRFQKNGNNDVYNKKSTGMWFSKDWSNKDLEPIFVPFYYQGTKEDISILLIRKPVLTSKPEYAIVPSYFSCFTDLKASHEVNKFNYNTVKNGMLIGLIVNVIGSYYMQDQNRAQEIIDYFENEHRGAENSNNSLVTFSPNKEEGIEFDVIQGQNTDAMYTKFTDILTQNILTAHSCTSPELFGVQVPSKLGNSSLIEAYTIFFDMVIRPDQLLIENGLNRLLKEEGIKIKIKNKNSTFKFSLDNSLLEKLLTEDELRESIGYAPKEEQSKNQEE